MLTILVYLYTWTQISQHEMVGVYQKDCSKDIQYKLYASQVKQKKYFDIRFKCQQQQQASHLKFVMIYTEW